MKIKKRLDVLLVEQGYADSRTKAQAIIMSGQVYVDGQKADKPGTSYEENISLEVRGASCPYVSRGGLKLEKRCGTLVLIPPDMFAVTPVPPPEALRIACCNKVQARSLPLM